MGKASEEAEQVRRTLCNRDCPDTCGIVATVQRGRVVRLRGDPDHPITRGFLCYRTQQFLSRQYSPERLRQPLLRKAGTLTPVSWDEALDHVADKLCEIRARSGPSAIFHYRSGGSLGLLKSLTDHFFQLFGPVTVKRGDICSGAGEEAQRLDFGVSDSSDPSTLLDARHILLWGKNLHVSSPHVIPLVKRARARGAGVVLIDPVAHASARLADHQVQPAPGRDFSLAMAVAQVLFARGWVDDEAAHYCDHLRDFRALCESRSVESWCREADVTPAQATDLARRLGVDGPCAILVGWGMGRRLNGGACVRAVDALSAISGNLGVRGGGASFYFQRRRGFGLPPAEGHGGAPRSISEPLFARGILEQRDPPIAALWVTAGNPVAMLPDSERSAAAIRSLELSVVVDSFLTDTARQASVVLPTTTLLEDDDLLGAYGHQQIGVSRPVVPAPDGVLSDLEIIQALARRVGLEQPLAGNARAWKRRLIGKELRDAGVELDRLENEGPMRNPLAPRVLFADRRFPTPSGKVNLITQAPETPPPSDDAYPLTLMALSTRNAQSSQWALSAPTRLTATVHPDAAPGFESGARGRVESAVGSLEVDVELDPRQRRDVLLVPKGGHRHLGASANSLLEGRLTDVGEGGALYDQRVRLVRIT